MWLLLLAATLGCEQARGTNILIEELLILSAGNAQAETLRPCARGFIINGNGAAADTIAEVYFTAVDATETAYLLQPKNIEGYMPAEAAILIEQALDPGGTVRNPVKSEHAGERWNLRQSALLNQL
jgi:hypothetical protein